MCRKGLKKAVFHKDLCVAGMDLCLFATTDALSDQIPEYYANILGIRTGPHDVEMVFGLTHPIRGSKALLRIRTSRSHFQAIGETIMHMIKQEKAS